jgi:hypothetical protein
MDNLEFNEKYHPYTIETTETQNNFEIYSLTSSEIEEISGGLLHIRKLPQIENVPEA